ncbi:beta-microseminoprotein [Ictalurus punctatus]|uniref:Beta-microseminoprotein n=1 Tax=Ictalurus punctatus TaxID=7998 RepID=A0A2D0SMP2_ICTPU|nr:beta-microseminoprotein [Ictalurus punctatus]
MSMLKRSVFVGFVLLALVHVSHAACWSGRNNPGATHCLDPVDETLHPVGSRWTNSECVKCSCNANSLSCCHGWPTGTTKGCIIEYDYEKCTYEIINLVDPSLPCGAAGK